MPRLRSVLTAFLLLFCLMPLGTPLGMVLCVGADGHIALEPAHDRSRGASSWWLVCQQTSQGLSGVAHPVPCSDVAFFSADGAAQSFSVSGASPKPEEPLFLPALPGAPASSEWPLAPIFLERSLRMNPSLTSLRSVTLRI